MPMTDAVIKIIAEMTARNPEDITPDHSIAELAHDSIQLFELFLRLEKEAGGSLTYEEVAHIETVKDVVSFLEARQVTLSL